MSAPTDITLFQEAVGSVLNGWTVLQLAVEYGFGGYQSKEKAAWMSYAIDKWFSENANLDAYEVEDYLSEVLNTEFDTIADDGSLPDIAKEICTMYQLCQAGKKEEVRQKIQSMPKAQVDKSQRANSEEQEIGGPEHPDALNSSQTPQMIIDENMTEETNTTTISTGDAEMEEEEDGWKVVTKGRSKKNCD
ncbi:TSR2 [Acanthosepion pharaonis]|uniref:Pre-rRNA-processing protein TSR2 homolog n=1 Tax=Acanthosepion pharaonis TaxID=158019 RepID=A0A812B797_ACAPH|nr:TSR2 [Sepia pharaonis]